MRTRTLGAWMAALLMIAACETEPGTTTFGEVTSTTAPVTTTTIPSQELKEAVQAATVRIVAGEIDDQDNFVSAWIGSGGIISPDGLILTNAHVAAPEAPGLERLYATPEEKNPEQLLIGMTLSADQDPDYRFLAEVLTVDGWLDLAVLQIVSDVEGNPVDELDLPSLAIGDSDLLAGLDPISVFGYPTTGRETITFTTGIVSGFVADEKIDGLNRGWIKTDAVITGGNSGGVAVNADFELVAVPTRGPDTGVQQMRPINLALDLIEDAKAGMRYERGSSVVAGTGSQTLDIEGWGSTTDEQGCLTDASDLIPSGPREVIAEFTWSGFTQGEDVLWIWLGPQDLARMSATNISDGWVLPPAGQCLTFPLQSRDQATLPDGQYSLAVFAGERLRRISQVSTEVGGAADTEERVEVTATVNLVDGDTGTPIAGGTIAFLIPGTDAEEWWTADELDFDKVYVTGTSGEDGSIELKRPLVVGDGYPWVGIGPENSGYKVALGCCFTPAEDPTGRITIRFTLFKAN